MRPSEMESIQRWGWMTTETETDGRKNFGEMCPGLFIASFIYLFLFVSSDSFFLSFSLFLLFIGIVVVVIIVVVVVVA